MRFEAFYYNLHKNRIGQLFGTSRDNFCPPPTKKIHRKEIDNLFTIFCVHFQKLFVEFVVLLTKFGIKY